MAVDINIAFVWVLRYSNIKGNETAEKAVTKLQMLSDLKMKTCDLKNQCGQTTSQMLNIK
jgi:hypothetical protein